MKESKIEDEPLELITAMECRKNGYEVFREHRTYCTQDKCIYRHDRLDKVGYRCMMLKKQVD